MKLFTITQNDSEQRLDRFLKKLLPNASKSLIYKINRKWKVKVDRKKQDNEYKLQVGEKVEIFLSDQEFWELSQVLKTDTIIDQKTKFDRSNIVYEDGDLLVINKDAGINVHPWDHKTKESNIISQVQDYLWNIYNSLTFKPSLVHRIDRDTSGMLLVAKKKHILTALAKDFKEHKNISKVYYAVVIWKLPQKSWKINSKLLRIENAKNENKMQVSELGKPALTEYKVLQEHTLQTQDGTIALSELEVDIKTGRMHQIRVHLASIGHPIVWDKAYGDKKINWFFAKNYWLARQALHAWKIQIFHPGKQKNLRLEAKIKKDLTDFINQV